MPTDVTASDEFTVREVFRHVNTFRNRFAHVPFPYDEMGKLSETLAEVTEQLFSVEPKPWQSFPDDRLESPLNGAIECRFRRLRGSMPPQLSSIDVNAPQHVFPAMPTKPAALTEMWDAAPFVFVDSMFRPSVLTRLISEADGVWEYTRFLAERNSVVRDKRPEYLTQLPAPAATDYPLPPEEQHEESTIVADASGIGADSPGRAESLVASTDAEFEGALRNIANEEYEPAIEFFQNLANRRPGYHIGWLRLGHALRELAMRKKFSAPDEATVLFSRSIEALSRASEHSHLPRQAQALYERSKAYYHRGRNATDAQKVEDLQAAILDAVEAQQRFRDTRYETWIAYLHQHGVNTAEGQEPA